MASLVIAQLLKGDVTEAKLLGNWGFSPPKPPQTAADSDRQLRAGWG